MDRPDGLESGSKIRLQLFFLVFSKIYVTKTPRRDYLGNKQDKDEAFDP